jgi:cytosine deaminase
MQNSGINFAICPNENLHLQGRGISPTPRGIAPVKELIDAGLNVAFCQDSIKDPWYPMGAGDPLRILDSALHVAHLLAEPYLSHSLDFVTTNPAKNMEIDNSITVGNDANLLVLNAKSALEAVRTKADVILSIHNGQTVFELEPPTVDWKIKTH